LFRLICREQHTQLSQENWVQNCQSKIFGAFGRLRLLMIDKKGVFFQ